MLRRVMCAAALAAAAAAALAAAQDRPSRPAFRLETNYVRVDLHATQGDRAVEDLRSEELELFEDGVPQKIEAFEHVAIQPSGGRTDRDARRRVIVIFLDNLHVGSDAAPKMRDAAVRLLEATAGDNDLVALMHPRMSARSVRLGRKTDVIAELLTEEWTWADKLRDAPLDPVEQQWFYCYGKGQPFEEMRTRRRERMSLDALSDLVTRLRGLREERKAVLLVTEGWQLFGQSKQLASLRRGDDCHGARLELAAMDGRRAIRELAGDANRGNVTFYPVFPRKIDQLEDLASSTDGVVVANAADVERAARRIAADLTTYYLLGYSSTNTKADGQFREISVRVKRPGVQIRARRGYRALTRDDAETVRAKAAALATTRASSDASAAVSGILHRPDEMVNPVNLASLRHVVLWKRGPVTGRDYVATEDPRLRRTDRLRLEHATTMAGTATAKMLDGAGKPMIVPVQVSERPDPSGNYRWVIADATLAPLAPGEYSIELTIGDLKVQTHFQIVP